MRGLSSRSTKSLESWKSRAKMAERQAKLLEKLLIVKEAQEAKLKEKLKAS